MEGLTLGRKRTRIGTEGREPLAGECSCGGKPYARDLCHRCYMRDYRAAKRAPVVVYNALPFPDSHFEEFPGRANKANKMFRESG